MGACGSVKFGEEPGSIGCHNFDYSHIAEKADGIGELTVAASSRWTWHLFCKSLNGVDHLLREQGTGAVGYMLRTQPTKWR